MYCSCAQVRHLDFIRAVDSVFGAFDLEKLPGAKVPKPGHCLKKHGEDIQVCDDEAAVEAVLRRLALLVKTRGVARTHALWILMGVS